MSSGKLQYSPRYWRSSSSAIQDVRIRPYQLSVSFHPIYLVTMKLMDRIVVSFLKHITGGIS